MSKLLFLGTGAADWNEKTDWERADFRGFTSLLLDETILIDISSGCFSFVDRFGKPDLLKQVDTVFITHSHGDHFQSSCLKRLCTENRDRVITLYGDSSLEALLPDCDNLRFVPLDGRFQTECTCHGYHVTALRANHCTERRQEQALHYYFKGEKSLFIGFDGGWLMADTWEFLLKHPIDVYVMDSTCGDGCRNNFRNFSHNNPLMRDLIRDTCVENGVLNEHSVILQTHVAKTLNPPHKELAEQSAQKGYLTAYDGMEYRF